MQGQVHCGNVPITVLGGAGAHAVNLRLVELDAGKDSREEAVENPAGDAHQRGGDARLKAN